MITFENLNEIEIPGKTAVALGNFDGVHLGHRKLISEMVDYGRENNLKTLVFTFSNHPRDLLPDATKKKNILHRNEFKRAFQVILWNFYTCISCIFGIFGRRIGRASCRERV